MTGIEDKTINDLNSEMADKKIMERNGNYEIISIRVSESGYSFIIGQHVATGKKRNEMYAPGGSEPLVTRYWDDNLKIWTREEQIR